MTTKEKKTEMVLRMLGVNGAYIGYHYMVYALNRVVEDKMLLTYISKGLYVEIAKKFQTTTACVERDLRTVVQVIWNYGDKEMLGEMAGKKLDKRPGNSEFLDIVSGYLGAAWEEEV